jgi:hypothetical protein
LLNGLYGVPLGILGLVVKDVMCVILTREKIRILGLTMIIVALTWIIFNITYAMMIGGGEITSTYVSYGEGWYELTILYLLLIPAIYVIYDYIKRVILCHQ